MSSSNQVIVYDDSQYRGFAQTLDVGNYDWGQIHNDTISSLRVPDGMRVTLYSDTHFQGKSKTFTQDTPYVGDDFNDITSSIIVEGLGGLIKGYWDKTWSPGNPFTDATLGIAFSGWADLSQALSDSASVKNQLVGDKYISVGGGNANGRFDYSKIERIIAVINNGQLSDYKGIAFDIEECDSGLTQKFREAFATAKNNHLQVLVTVSHSAPYGAADAKDLMTAFFADGNIDYLSPQLYTSGNESQNDYTESMGVSWTDYAGAKAAMVPSIVQAGLYNDAKNFFQQRGINTKGFIQWA
ncbi:beta/gamma crystallin family protein [Aetokthonos hydrillicola Thurmond2011]|jgi:hypothetical protein|uniref:Beta/gamma crystallin family protein n=2 Tax=Aetokthonos TaxID=1550243 RepID=A0AAP5I6T3_9CYAN|nr:hypothetical protein [Aetokthonos hydrillicola]MBO3458588.1 beta/gamma crystallin family protein [Aetokthonos hydrillicola CCALA 1050]MBW4585031.1 beta/gamma crystallin family protein [Aetokthonos hydrillicola CCALA 1050]MDR9894208.1 beta/gamma crystallin family protein [Aetokthonos hydrillicola Thurmond2011]